MNNPELPRFLETSKDDVTLKVDGLRGNLISYEFTNFIPFTVRRTFYVFMNKMGIVRGNHGHKRCWQVLVCLHGNIEVSSLNLLENQSWRLSEPTLLLLVPPWNKIQYISKSESSILGVFSSDKYDPEDFFY